MDRQTYIQLDRIEKKLDILLELEDINIDQQGNITNTQQKITKKQETE